MVIAVDFDGTLADTRFPEIMGPRKDVIAYCKLQRHLGNKLILWTCRVGEDLEAAVQFCKEQGLEFDAINDHLPEQKARWNNDTRKIWADMYIDDKNVSIDTVKNAVEMIREVLDEKELERRDRQSICGE